MKNEIWRLVSANVSFGKHRGKPDQTYPIMRLQYLKVLIPVLLLTLAGCYREGNTNEQRITELESKVNTLTEQVAQLQKVDQGEVKDSQVQNTPNSLRTGSYRSFNYYLYLYEKEGRFCLVGVSKNGMSISSLHLSSSDPNLYQIPSDQGGFTEMGLTQINPETLSYLGSEYARTGDIGTPEDGSAEQECLNSIEPYRKLLPSPLDRGAG